MGGNLVTKNINLRTSRPGGVRENWGSNAAGENYIGCLWDPGSMRLCYLSRLQGKKKC